MKLLGDSYYQDRPVPHTAQGDFYADVPLPVYVGEKPIKASGARKRPLSFMQPEPTVSGLYEPRQRLVVVCAYTCNFVAQPPGQRGYSHPLRQVAPVLPLAQIVSSRGLQKTEARKLVDSGSLAGLLWVPRPPGYTPEKPTKGDGEFDDDYVVLLYALGMVHQNALDASERVARLTRSAQKLLIAGLIAGVSPNTYEPDDIEDPDMSSSW